MNILFVIFDPPLFAITPDEFFTTKQTNSSAHVRLRPISAISAALRRTAIISFYRKKLGPSRRIFPSNAITPVPSFICLPTRALSQLFYPRSI